MTTWTPLANYTGYNHILFASACFVHPKNGNIYFCACEQHDGVHQNLSVYRYIATTGAIEHVKTYFGGSADSPAQITQGGAVIGQGGAMFVATSLTIPNVPKVTVTGWQGSWIREPNIDEPWNIANGTDPRVDALVAQLASLSQRVTATEGALANLGTGGALSPEDAANLAWLAQLRAVIGGA